MKRRYETTIEIKPVIGNVGFESGTDSGDDIDSIQSEFYESALEQVERNFCDFDPTKINITARDPLTRTSHVWDHERFLANTDFTQVVSRSLITEPASIPSMFFEKKSFFYWLEDGIIEISVESRQCGKWKTIDDNISAKGFIFVVVHMLWPIR